MKKKLSITAVLLCLVLISAALLAGCGGEAAVTTSTTARQFKENWGISLAVEDATATGLTLVCTQSGGGQQLGTLMLDSFMLYSYETDDLIDNKEGAVGNYFREGRERIAVELDATDRITVDWSEGIGSLSSGKYMIVVSVLDYIDREKVQPSNTEKQYLQDHTIEFTIP